MSAVQHETYNRVFGTAYTLLVTGALVAVAVAPFLVVLVITPSAWLLVPTAPLLGPAVAAAHAVFAADAGDVVRGYLRAWRRHARRSLAVSGTATGVLLVLAVDVRAAWGTSVGAVAIPVLAVLAVLTAVTALVALTAVVERPDLPVRRLLPACLALAVRAPHFTVLSLVALWVHATAISAAPVLAVALLTGPALYVVWAGNRATLRPVLATA
ncbi:MAG: ferredoxin-NADPH reductase [Saccharothrix sp.]|nr:ferredoxin-NADPH reductase [Saccharothrix sp.]